MNHSLLRRRAKLLDPLKTTLAIEHLEPRRLMSVDLAPVRELLAVPGIATSTICGAAPIEEAAIATPAEDDELVDLLARSRRKLNRTAADSVKLSPDEVDRVFAAW